MNTIDSKVLDWFVTGETGTSSKAMAAHLTGRDAKGGAHNYPRDGGDFHRCRKLLEAVPELRARLPKMAELGPYWTALVARWSDIEAAEDSGADVYALMKSILRPIEDKDRGIVRLSDNVSFRFGA